MGAVEVISIDPAKLLKTKQKSHHILRIMPVRATEVRTTLANVSPSASLVVKVSMAAVSEGLA